MALKENLSDMHLKKNYVPFFLSCFDILSANKNVESKMMTRIVSHYGFADIIVICNSVYSIKRKTIVILLTRIGNNRLYYEMIGIKFILFDFPTRVNVRLAIFLKGKSEKKGNEHDFQDDK